MKTMALLKNGTRLTKASVRKPSTLAKWTEPAIIAPNNFLYKSLSNWAFNISIGCSHGCLFCYVPSTSANKQARKLKEHGVKDPDAQWGQYSLLRQWDEKKFLASLQRAEKTSRRSLKKDGNRAVLFCSTTDPFQTFKGKNLAETKQLNQDAEAMVVKALELIRDQSTLNVRILTRSALAQKHFKLFKSFGNRLMFGMSLPTLRDDLRSVYEPKAPGIQVRVKCLHAAKQAGLNIFVAMAPTFPECDEVDLLATLKEIKKLNPLTIFHEPINVRAGNVERIVAESKKVGVTLNTAVFASGEARRSYALNSLFAMQRLAGEAGVLDRLHLWPDKDLISEQGFLNYRKSKWHKLDLTAFEIERQKKHDQEIYENEYRPWLQKWWERISEWPTDKVHTASKP